MNSIPPIAGEIEGSIVMPHLSLLALAETDTNGFLIEGGRLPSFE